VPGGTISKPNFEFAQLLVDKRTIRLFPFQAPVEVSVRATLQGKNPAS
jgi:hypothetical protein